MKKWLIGIAIVLVVAIAAVYVLIPGTLRIVCIGPAKCNANGAARILVQQEIWQSGWKRGGSDRKDEFSGYGIRVGGTAFHVMDLYLERGRDTLLSRLSVLNIAGMADSVALDWRCQFVTSLNPLKRVEQYRQAVSVKQMMDTVLSRIRGVLQKTENIYKIPMVDSMSNDSVLLTVRFHTSAYPSTADIYKRVASIRKYIAQEGACAINYPMLHVSKQGDEGFDVMVAISVDRRLNGNDQIVPKRYVPWKIMVGEVKGGPWSAEQGMRYLQQYVSDHQKPAMGLPFQSMVTERDKEPDTSRWITRVVQAVP